MKYDADIFDAIELDDLASVKLYWREEIDVNWQDNQGMNMLMYAVSYSNIEIIDFLLLKKPNLQLVNNANENVIEMAERIGNQEIIDIFRA